MFTEQRLKWLTDFKKGVMISHRNVIANVLQFSTLDKSWRDKQKTADGSYYTDVTLGLLPQSHIYGLIVICHAAPFRGDQVIVLPRFELRMFLDAVQKYKISSLFVVSRDFPTLKLSNSSGPSDHHQHAPQSR